MDRGGSRRPYATLRSGSCDDVPPHTAPPWSAPCLRDPHRLWRRRTAVCSGGRRRAAATQDLVGRGAMPFFGIVRPDRTDDDCCALRASHWSWVHPSRRATAARRFEPVAGWSLFSTALRSTCGTGAFLVLLRSLKASQVLAYCLDVVRCLCLRCSSPQRIRRTDFLPSPSLPPALQSALLRRYAFFILRHHSISVDHVDRRDSPVV